jgi:phosphate acyltransferase
MQATISIDVMGGDFGTKVTIPATYQALKKDPNFKVILVGNQAEIESELKNWEKTLLDRIEIVHASEKVLMDESPLLALRNKKESSLRIAINLVKENRAKAIVSAGNTGALMATAKFVLKTIPGIDRPAIISSLPTFDPQKEFYLLDLGANVSADANQLHQFAIMASVLVKSVAGIANPKIALLNVGAEEIKGNEQVKAASTLLEKNPALNYIGYIEGDAMFRGEADVVVCDGFVGNIALKAIEGLAKMISSYLKRIFTANFYAKLIALLAKPMFNKLAKEIDPGKRNGASLLGLQGIVIKSHGGARIDAFTNAILVALKQTESNLVEKVSTEVDKILREVTA